MTRSLAAFALVASLSAVASAEGKLPLRYEPRTPAPGMSSAVSSNVIFLDRCVGGCLIHKGGDDSRTDTTSIGGSQSGTLSAFSCGDAAWNQLVTCVKETFYDYNVVITTTDPGTADHLEIKIAGSSDQIHYSPAGGVAPFYCLSYEQDALVFVFPQGLGCDVNEMCSAAAQEIAHTWSLDHVVNAADPLTYFAHSGIRYFSDNTQCGSDCSNSAGQYCQVGDAGCRAPDGASCTTAQVHTCTCTNTSVQNDNQTVLGLFGPSTPVPPTVKITKPLDGSALAPGFPVDADITSDYGISKAELRVDGQLSGSAVTSTPYVFNAPDTLSPGQHTVEVTGYDSHNTPGKASINIIIGNPCTKASDCPDSTQTCLGGRCIAGSGVPGGLGATCNQPSDCLEGQCASDGTNMYCTSPCTVGQCPSGFGCLPTQMGADGSTGVCWPNYEDGSGGGGCSTTGGGPLVLGLAGLGLALSRRRPARA